MSIQFYILMIDGFMIKRTLNSYKKKDLDKGPTFFNKGDDITIVSSGFSTLLIKNLLKELLKLKM